MHPQKVDNIFCGVGIAPEEERRDRTGLVNLKGPHRKIPVAPVLRAVDDNLVGSEPIAGSLGL